MNSLSSTSIIFEPIAFFTKRGSQPTDLQARTGLLTPPGITVWAFAKYDFDLSMFMGYFPPVVFLYPFEHFIV
jgi:hypothetical protein